MVIHHDKMAYGKLESLTEKMTDEKLAQMAKLLSADSEKKGGQEEKDGNCCGKDKKKNGKDAAQSAG